MAGRNDVGGLTSFLPTASITKNIMTLYTLFIVLIAMLFAFPLFYVNNGLFTILNNFGHLQQPVYLYTVGFYIFYNYAGTYLLVSEEMVWSKDDQFRSFFVFPPCMIFTACMIIYVGGNEVGLWHAVLCEIVARQISLIICTCLGIHFASINGPSDKLYSVFHSSSGRLEFIKVISSYIGGAILMFVSSLIHTLFFAVEVIPLSLSFLNFNEFEQLVVYEFLFPIVRYIVGFFYDVAVSRADKAGLLSTMAHNNLKFAGSLSTSLFFSLSPLFCMLFLSPSPLSFAATYTPHAFFCKLMWVRNIPQVKAFFANMISILEVCLLGRQTVSPYPQNQTEIMNDNVLTEVDRNRIEVVNDSVLTEVDRNRIEEEDRRRREQERIAISNSGAIREASDSVGTKITIILMILRLCLLCFFQSDGSENKSTISFDDFKNLFILVFCIILPIDQLSATIGFALLAQSGHPVDANFYLDINILNPIRSWRNGNRFKAIGGLSYCVFFIMAICCGIAVGTNGPLL